MATTLRVIGDIHKFTHGLSEAAASLGVKTIYDHEVTSVQSDGNHVNLTLKKDGLDSQLVFDNVVVCAGVGSINIVSQLSDRVNVYTQ